MHAIERNFVTYIYCLGVLCFIAVALAGCRNDEEQSGLPEEYTHISLSVRMASATINEDKTYWEDRVDELRMLVFDSRSGEIVYNEMLYFPSGFTGKSKSVRLRPGNYNFYFIANESVYEGDFVSALLDITTQTAFITDSRFRDLPYNPDFTPDGNTPAGRFLMSAVYTNIPVVSGGTDSNPILLPLPTAKVELIRTLAKVEVIFRKKLSGSIVPVNAITSVQLNNVAANLSAPPYDHYYAGSTTLSAPALLSGFNYENDSIGAVTFYIPEFLVPENGSDYTELGINDKRFPVLTDSDKAGITAQRRTVPELSDNTVIRNYHYVINAYINTEGGVEIKVYVAPWRKDTYTYIFQGDEQITIPPVIPTDSSIVIPTVCGKVEILSRNENLTQGLQGAYNDVVNYYDPAVGGPVIYRGEAPYYCEKKYGEGWRLINSCELMSFLATLDAAYNVWMCNTWETQTYNTANPDAAIPFYPVYFRKTAQALLEKLTGVDLSACNYQEDNNWRDELVNKKLDIVDNYFTPGDIVEREMDHPGGWPFPSPPGTSSGESWYYNEVVIQVKAFWYGSGYVSLADRNNWERILYGSFVRYDYGSTVSRCVRTIE